MPPFVVNVHRLNLVVGQACVCHSCGKQICIQCESDPANLFCELKMDARQDKHGHFQVMRAVCPECVVEKPAAFCMKLDNPIVTYERLGVSHNDLRVWTAKSKPQEVSSPPGIAFTSTTKTQSSRK